MTTNSVTALRKSVETNVPGFFDEEDIVTQNEWLRLYDFTCVEIYPAQTAAIYSMEHSANTSSNIDRNLLEMSFQVVDQQVQPPYDVKAGDYIGWKRGEERYMARIIKDPQMVEVLPGCCVAQFLVELAEPRGSYNMLACGSAQALTDAEIGCQTETPDPTEPEEPTDEETDPDNTENDEEGENTDE